MDLSTGVTTNATQVAAHEQAVRCVRFVDVPGSAGPVLVTGSWDKTVKYWDLRQQTPVASIDCQERIYSMDEKNKMLVVATADRYINIVNLDSPTKFYKTLQSPLKWQTRCVTCFTDATGFAVGSIEGRCAIQHVEEKDARYFSSNAFSPIFSPQSLISANSSNFSFKCHRKTVPNVRETSEVFSVNAISFHPVHGTFSTAGSDGTFHFWDKDAKHRLKGYPEVGGTISSTAFNKGGTIFAYAVSYDWSKGYALNTPQTVNKVMLHPVGADECKPRPKSTKR